MSNAWLLLFALVGLHIVEGFLWVRRRALGFAAGRRFYVRQQVGGPLGTPDEVLISLSPFPPLRELFVTEP